MHVVCKQQHTVWTYMNDCFETKQQSNDHIILKSKNQELIKSLLANHFYSLTFFWCNF